MIDEMLILSHLQVANVLQKCSRVPSNVSDDRCIIGSSYSQFGLYKDTTTLCKAEVLTLHIGTDIEEMRGQILSLGSVPIKNHKATNEADVIIAHINMLQDLWLLSPFASLPERTDEIVDNMTKLHATQQDHSSTETKVNRLLKEYKKELHIRSLGMAAYNRLPEEQKRSYVEAEMRDLAPRTLVEDSGERDEARAATQREAAMRQVVHNFGATRFRNMTDADQSAVTDIVEFHCGNHKLLNIVAAMNKAMESYWGTQSDGPIKLPNTTQHVLFTFVPRVSASHAVTSK